MSFNGSGTFNLVSGNPVVTGTTISSTWANNTLSDVASGLSNCITRDGQSVPTANLPMGGYKLTGLAAGTTAGDSARYEQVTSAVAITGGTITGVTINNSAIGGSTPAAGAFTTLSASSTVTLSGGTANGVLYLNGSKAVTSGSVISFDGTTFTSGAHTLSTGNLTFSGTGQRITGDFSNATVANRVMFQTSTASSPTRVDAIPASGTTTAEFGVFNNSDPANASRATLTITSTEARVQSTISGTGSYLPLTFLTGGSERIRLDTSGNVGIGTSTPASILDVYDATNSTLYIRGDTTTALYARRCSTDASPPLLLHQKSRGTNASPTIVASGDILGRYLFYGYDGAAFQNAAEIRATVDGTPGAGDMPGRLAFFTVPDGSNTLTEAMRIDNQGNTYIETGVFWQYAPAPTAKSTTATLTVAELQTGIISTTGTTYTVTMPTGTAIDAGFTGVPATGIGFDFYVVNTASGTITMAVNTGVTSLGTLTVATGVSAHFRLRRTAANTYVLYRLS